MKNMKNSVRLETSYQVTLKREKFLKIPDLLLINRARWPWWESIARDLSGTERAKQGPYKKD